MLTSISFYKGPKDRLKLDNFQIFNHLILLKTVLQKTQNTKSADFEKRTISELS